MDALTPSPAPSGFASLLNRFRSHITDFCGFEAAFGAYFEHERRYKNELVDAYRQVVEPLLLEAADYSALHAAVVQLLAKKKLPSTNKPQNLLGFRSLIALKDLNETAAQSGALIQDLLRGEGDVFTRLDRFYPAYGELLAPVLPNGRQGMVRSLATLLLMLDRPADYIMERFEKFNAVARALDGEKLIGLGAWPSGDEYRRVLDLAARLRHALTEAGWPPRDQIDIQSFIWVAGGGWGPGENPPVNGPKPKMKPPISFDQIAEAIEAADFLIDRTVLRRYHASLRSRSLVILAGLSGSGKTWLTKLYAEAVGAKRLLCAVAPNWTGPEDLLGYLNPINGALHLTAFTKFVSAAAEEAKCADDEGRTAQEYHLVLDEMNLARVEHYFAPFLSAMEERAQDGRASLAVCPGHTVELTSNLRFIGTVNIDETTHDFSDKVYDRSQLVELGVTKKLLASKVAKEEWGVQLLSVWVAVQHVAPFAYRVAADVAAYVKEAKDAGATWQEALDEQVLQKILPKLRGDGTKLDQALEALTTCCSGMPLSSAKIVRMAGQLRDHGFVSYF